MADDRGSAHGVTLRAVGVVLPILLPVSRDANADDLSAEGLAAIR